MPYNKRDSGILTIKGLNIEAPAEYIDSRSTPDCHNVRIERNCIMTREGSSQFANNQLFPIERIMYGKEFKDSSNTYTTIITPTRLYVYNGITNQWNSKTPGVLTGTETDAFCGAIPIRSGARVLVFTNNVDNVKYFDGTNNFADLGGTPPKCKYLREYKSYLLLADVNDGTHRPMRVQWSNGADIEDWSAGDAGYVDLEEDGEEITGIGIIGNYVTIHKKSSIYVGYLVLSDDIFRFDRKFAVGAAVNNTIKELPDGTQIYLASDGIRIFNGSSSQLISAPINDELKDSINVTWISKAYGVVVRDLDEYWLAVPIGSETEPTTIYKYNYVTGQVHKDTRSKISFAFNITVGTSYTWDSIADAWNAVSLYWDSAQEAFISPMQLFCSTDGYTYKRNLATFNDGLGSGSVAVTDCFWTSKDYTDEMGRLIRWQQMELWAKGNAVQVWYSIDDGQTWTAAAIINLGGSYPSDSAPVIIYFDVVSSRIRFKFGHTIVYQLGENFNIKQFEIKGNYREMRQ